jgi:hypothetical protein
MPSFCFAHKVGGKQFPALVKAGNCPILRLYVQSQKEGIRQREIRITSSLCSELVEFRVRECC